jgi:hypothetical protein
MQTSMRVALLALVALEGALGVGFYVQLSWAVSLWPWPDSYLSYVFLSSYALAIAGGVLWVALSGSLGAAKGGLINLSVATAGMTVFLFQTEPTNHAVLPSELACLIACVGFMIVLWVIRREPVHDQRPTPLLVRVSFGVFTVVLVATGVALLLHDPMIFPWSLRAETSVMIGWAFLGAACYFLYGVLRPRWDNAGGQLLGFLSYDLVLIVPFLRQFANVPPGHLLSLVIYVVALVYSGALAIFYLFLNRATRRWALMPRAAERAESGQVKAAPPYLHRSLGSLICRRGGLLYPCAFRSSSNPAPIL